MKEIPPHWTAREYLHHIIDRLETLEEIQEAVDRVSELQREMGREHRWFHMIGAVLKWGGTVSTQLSTIFIAGYVAVEHSRYVAWIVNEVKSLFGG